MTTQSEQTGKSLINCFLKKRYREEGEAKRSKVKQTKRFGIKFRIYPCPHCKGWHLTKKV